MRAGDTDPVVKRARVDGSQSCAMAADRARGRRHRSRFPSNMLARRFFFPGAVRVPGNPLILSLLQSPRASLQPLPRSLTRRAACR